MSSFTYSYPIGDVTICTENGYITHVDFGSSMNVDAQIEETDLHRIANMQLNEYFEGKRKILDLPLKPKGTPFQLAVWEQLQLIPYGKTASYKDIALRINNEKAVRAVGMANNRNPLPIIVPCHRVIGTNGALVGYGGGLGIKQTLLKLEGITLNL
jgi:methylated-DNA-[protein]-cysteine S-methyltransferase